MVWVDVSITIENKNMVYTAIVRKPLKYYFYRSQELILTTVKLKSGGWWGTDRITNFELRTPNFTTRFKLYIPDSEYRYRAPFKTQVQNQIQFQTL